MDYTILSHNKEPYQRFLQTTIPHKRGYFILAPSGTGKTHYITRQHEPHWIDGDTLWQTTGAHPETMWWTQGIDVIKEVDARSDVITASAKKLGLWIMGASNNWLRPDAIVLPKWQDNVRFIRIREKGNYDGGLKSSQLNQLKAHRAEMRSLARAKKVPVFTSVAEAVTYVEQLDRKT